MSAISAPGVEMPLWARVHLAHALVQHVADASGADVLLLKGPALLPDLARARPSSDVDVLVRPGHERRLTDALAALGWEQRTEAESGSAFAHAANWWHDDWGYVDVHTSWPGPTASPEEVFAALAAPGARLEIAHVPCRVPDRVGQLLVLLLHAARSPDKSDVHGPWARSEPAVREEVLALARRLGAEVAVAAALGTLEDHADDPTYALWRYYSQGGSRLDEWRARLAAAPTRRARLRVLTSSLGVNRDYLRIELGRPPTRREVAARQWLRVRRLAAELVSPLRRSR